MASRSNVRAPAGAVPVSCKKREPGSSSAAPAAHCGQAPGSNDSIGRSSSAYSGDADIDRAAPHDHRRRGNDPARGAHDVDDFAHRQSGRDHVFDHQHALAGRNAEAAPKARRAAFFLDEDRAACRADAPPRSPARCRRPRPTPRTLRRARASARAARRRRVRRNAGSSRKRNFCTKRFEWRPEEKRKWPLEHRAARAQFVEQRLGRERDHVTRARPGSRAPRRRDRCPRRSAGRRRCSRRRRCARRAASRPGADRRARCRPAECRDTAPGTRCRSGL